MILLKIFLTFLKIGCFAFGGAYSFLPLIEREVVQTHHWLDKPEFLEILGIAKIFPGALSVKFATYTGYKVAGVAGAVAANLANLLPPITFIMIATLFYSKYKNVEFVKAGLEMIQYVVFAMVIAIAIQLVNKDQIFQPKHIIAIVVGFALFMFTKIHPAFIIVAAGIMGVIFR